MTRWERRQLVVAAVATVVALVLGVVLAGAARGAALYAYVLLLVGLAAMTLSARVRAAWPATPPFARLLPETSPPSSRIVQLEALSGRLAGGEPREYDVHHHLRPLVADIAAARLARAHGVDLEELPERAERLLGPRTWELVRPGREAPLDRFGNRWTPENLRELLDELERI